MVQANCSTILLIHKGAINSAVSPGTLPEQALWLSQLMPQAGSAWVAVCPNGGGNHGQEYGKTAPFHWSVASILKSTFQTCIGALKFCPVVKKKIHKWLKSLSISLSYPQSLPWRFLNTGILKWHLTKSNFKVFQENYKSEIFLFSTAWILMPSQGCRMEQTSREFGFILFQTLTTTFQNFTEFGTCP